MSNKPIKRTVGGQPPNSNQRASMPEYQRSDRPNYRAQNNTQGVHQVQSNSIPPVNMHSQVSAPQNLQQAQVPMQNPQMIRYPLAHAAPQGQQTLVAQPPIQVAGHVNSNSVPQQNVNLQHVQIRAQPPFQPYNIPNRVTLPPNHRPAAFNSHHTHPHRTANTVPPQMVNMQQPMFYQMQYGSPNTMFHHPIPHQLPMVNPYAPQMYLQPDQFSMAQQQRNQQQVYQTQMNQMPNNLGQQSEMINNTVMYQQQQQPKVETKKKEKHLMKFYDDSGNEVDILSLSKNKNKSTPSTDNANNEKPASTEEKAPVTTQSNETVNGIEEVEVKEEPETTDSPPSSTESSSQVVSVKTETTEPIETVKESTDSTSQVPLLDPAPTNVVPCDTEPARDSIVESADDTANETQQEVVVPVDPIDEIAAKVEEIVLEDGTEGGNLCDVIPHNENSAPLHDNSQIVSEIANSTSGDMDVNAAKCADESTSEQPYSDDDAIQTDEAPLPLDTKEDEDELEEGEITDDEPNLSRNSSQNGPKVYDRDILLSLREHASDSAINLSNQANLRDIVKRAGNNNGNNKAPSHDMFLPNFANSGGRPSQNDSYRNKSQSGASRRPSQPSRNYQDSKSRKITSTSLHHHEMYHPNENAWKPGKVVAQTPEEIETENLLRNVRAILNKLTPQNYNILLEQFKGLKIDMKIRLSRVIDLIFDKAVREPSFVVQYAGFCSELIHIKVMEKNEKGETVEVKFKNLLIEKCQETFFREMYSDVENYKERVKEIEECEDEKKKKELEDILDDDKRHSRKRSIGNIKLIAELYKLNMLNAKIMFACFMNLLKHQHEEYIECLCALITNIGLDLTNAIKKSKSNDSMESFDSIFKELKEIYDGKSKLKASSRIRFTILDLIDLRKDNWIPRRKAEGPKTIAQVHEDMDQEARRKNMEAIEFNKKKKMGPRDQDEWQQVKSRKSSSVTQSKFTLSNLNVLKESLSTNKPTIGGNSPFGMFAHGSHGGTNSNSQSRSSSSNFENKYHLLSDKNPKSNSTFHDSLNAKDIRRDERKTSDVTNYYQSPRDSSQPNSRNSSVRGDVLEAKAHIDIDGIAFEEKTTGLMKAYFKSQDFITSLNDLLTFCSKARFHHFICQSMAAALEKHTPQRQLWGEFLGKLFVSPAYDSSEIFEGFKALFACSSDIIVDLPKFWEFVAEIIAYTLVGVHELNTPKSKDVFKFISRAFGEVTGSDYSKLTKSLTDNLFSNAEDTVANDIISQLQLTNQSNAKNDIQSSKSVQNAEGESTADDLFQQCMVSNRNISELETRLEKGNPDSKKIISALLHKCLNLYANSKDRRELEPKLLDICSHCVKIHEEAELELLFVSGDIFRELNSPHNLLNELFTFFLQNKLVSNDTFTQWRQSKRTNTLAAASVERFFTFLSSSS